MALKVERRMEPSRAANVLVPVFSVVAALVAGGSVVSLNVESRLFKSNP